MDWPNVKVLVTDRASFIGSHLTDALAEHAARVRLVADLSRGKLENTQEHLTAGRIESVQTPLREPCVAWVALKGRVE